MQKDKPVTLREKGHNLCGTKFYIAAIGHAKVTLSPKKGFHSRLEEDILDETPLTEITWLRFLEKPCLFQMASMIRGKR